MRLRKEYLLVGALVVLLTLGLVLRNFPFTSGRLHEDVLPCKSTNDAFWHQAYGECVIQEQDARFLPPYLAEGRTDVYTHYMNVPYVLIGGLAQFTTIPAYQMTYLLFNLLAVFQAGVLFVLVRRLFNAEMAVLATALALFPANAAWLFQQHIGFFFDIYAYLYVLVLLFFLIEFIQRSTWRIAALIGLFMATLFYSHIVELVLFIPFLLIVMGFFFIRRRLNWAFFARVAAIGAVFLIISAYYIPFQFGQQSYVTSQGLSHNIKLGQPQEKPGYFPDFNVPASIWVLILVALPIYLVAKHPSEKRASRFLLLSFIVYWFLVSKSNMIGLLGHRAYRQLMSGYGLFMVLAAFTVYILLDQGAKLLKIKGKSVLFIGALCLSAVLVVQFFSPVYASLAQINKNSFIDSERWDALTWVRKNTPKDALVFTLNGYLHNVGGRFSQRPEMKGDLNVEDNVQNIINICNGMVNDTLPEIYLGQCSVNDPNKISKIPVERIALFTYRWENITICDLPHYVTPDGEESKALLFPLEHVDYVLLQYSGTGWVIGQNYDPCIQFFINKTLERGFELVYPNAQHPNSKMAVLRVNKDG